VASNAATAASSAASSMVSSISSISKSESEKRADRRAARRDAQMKRRQLAFAAQQQIVDVVFVHGMPHIIQLLLLNYTNRWRWVAGFLDLVGVASLLKGLLGSALRTWRLNDDVAAAIAKQKKKAHRPHSAEVCWPRDWLPDDIRLVPWQQLLPSLHILCLALPFHNTSMIADFERRCCYWVVMFVSYH
jgi:hypothetical protein